MFNQEQSLATQPQNNLTTKSDVGAKRWQAQEVQAAVVTAKRFPRIG